MNDVDNRTSNSGELPLFYKDPRPLDFKLHAGIKLHKDFGFGYCSETNAVPINVIEMAQICHSYPIAFSPDGNGTPVAILGLRDSENLFLTNLNNWRRDHYIPAYVRRYPFIFSEQPGTDSLTLCADFSAGILDENGAHPIFNEDGSPSELANNALEFCKSYHAAAQQTIGFSKKIVELDLLVEREATLEVRDKARITFSGFNIIDEKRLAQLSDAAYMELKNEGYLPFIYAHLFSGAQWQRLTSLLSAHYWSIEEGNDPLSRTVRDIANLISGA